MFAGREKRRSHRTETDTSRARSSFCFSVKGDEALSIAEDLKELKKSTKGMTNAQLTRYKLVITVKGGMTKGRTKVNSKA